MNVVYGDLWAMDGIRCVTTNGTVMDNGRNIMGGGVALPAARRLDMLGIDLPHIYGSMIETHGHHVMVIFDLIMFPTKETIEENATLETIDRSLYELIDLWKIYRWEKILLPAPGAGLGGLQWEDVAHHIEPLIYGESFEQVLTIVRYEKERPSEGQATIDA